MYVCMYECIYQKNEDDYQLNFYKLHSNHIEAPGLKIY